MSEMEYHSGKLRKIPMKMDDSLEQQCRRIILELDPDLDLAYVSERYNSFEELMRDDYCQEYLVLNGRVYEILEHSQSDDDTFDVWQDENDIINFVGSFYNGGTCLNEMLEDSLKSM